VEKQKRSERVIQTEGEEGKRERYFHAQTDAEFEL
jgi:hypothetical protein